METCQEYLSKATFFSPSDEWVLPAASTIKREEREFVVDSGASMHMVSERDLNSVELETMRTSKSPTTVMTAKGEVQTREEATGNVKRIGLTGWAAGPRAPFWPPFSVRMGLFWEVRGIQISMREPDFEHFSWFEPSFFGSLKTPNVGVYKKITRSLKRTTKHRRIEILVFGTAWPILRLREVEISVRDFVSQNSRFYHVLSVPVVAVGVYGECHVCNVQNLLFCE